MAGIIPDEGVLHNYCREGKIDKITEYFESVDQDTLNDRLNNRRGVFGYTPLHEAISGKKHEVIKYVIERGANGNAKANSGYTPLHLAASAGHIDCVRELLSCGVDLNISDDYGKTAMQTAGLSSNSTIVRMLRSEEIIREVRRNGDNLSNLLELPIEDLEHNCLEMALVAAVENDSHFNIGKLVVKGAKNVKEALQLSQRLQKHEARAILLLITAAVENDKDLIRKLFGAPIINTTSVPTNDHDFSEVQKAIINRKVSTVVPIGIAQRKQHIAIRDELLLHTDVNQNEGSVDWHGLRLLNLELSFLRKIYWVQHLRLARNGFRTIPNEIGSYLKQVVKLDLQRNELSSVPQCLFEFPCLNDLNLSYNKLTEIPKLREWSPGLAILNLAHNELSFLPEDVIAPSIHTLNLEYNKFNKVPKCVCSFFSLQNLDISYNPDILILPVEMGRLLNLNKLLLNGLKDLNDPPRNIQRDARDCIRYLNSKLRSAQKFYRMKLMLVGKQDRGKTTLVARLHGKGVGQNQSTVGVDVSQWSYAGRFNRRRYHFSIWDFGGQKEYYATHQCFLSEQSMYLLLWNVTHGKEGIRELKPWLDNIYMRAPHSCVIIVATHLDEIRESERSIVDNLLHQVSELTENYSAKLHIQDVLAVGLMNKIENIGALREAIYSLATIYTGKGTLPIMGREVPSSYFKLNTELERIQERVRTGKIEPIMHAEQFKDLVQQLKLPDIWSNDELHTATLFLNEVGTILHYNDRSHGLHELYFIDPHWLCEMMSKVVTVHERNPFVKNGILPSSDVPLLFRDTRFPWKYFEQYLTLLDRFEIALPLDNTRILIPSMLPEERPREAEMPFDPRGPYYRRYITFSSTPPGFWSRLISRVMHSVPQVCKALDYNYENIMFGASLERDGVAHVTGNKRTNSASPTNATPTTPFLLPNIPRFIDIDDSDDFSDPKDVKLIYWREGIVCKSPELNLCVEALHNCGIENKINSNGILIMASPLPKGKNTLCLLVDIIMSLIHEWYPGLEEVGCNEGVKQIVPCYECLKMRYTLPHEFHIDAYKSLITSNRVKINCSNDHSVALADVMPDVLLQDLDKRFLLSQEEVIYQENADSLLGEGGFGRVYKGKCRGKNVAIKKYVFHTQIEDAFDELRVEAKLLQKSHHPCLVCLVGVTLYPLMALVMEEAPMGSLEKHLITKATPIPRIVLFRIASQVAAALRFLHQHGIVFRDLKASNVLLWSLDEESLCHCKVTDFGIATHLSPFGTLRIEGTKGFIAPEVLNNAVYNHKADIFSFSMLLYQMITRRHPFHSIQPLKINLKILNGERPSTMDISVAEIGYFYLTRVMESCWEHKPENRPDTDELITRLSDVIVQSTMSMLNVSSRFSLRRGCAVTSRDYAKAGINHVQSSELWICCDGEKGAELNIYNTNHMVKLKKHFIKRNQVQFIHVCGHHIWVCSKAGIESGVIDIFNIISQDLVHTIDIRENAACCITAANDCVYLGTLEGYVFAFKFAVIQAIDCHQHQYVSENAIEGIIATKKHIWVSHTHFISFLDIETLTIENQQTRNGQNKKDFIGSLYLSEGNNMVWSAQCGGSVLSSWNVETETHMYDINICQVLLSIYDCEEYDAIITCMTPALDTLWVGMATGHIMVFHDRELLFYVRPYEEYIRFLIPIPCEGPTQKEKCMVVSGAKHFQSPLPEFSTVLPKLKYKKTYPVGQSGVMILWEAYTGATLRQMKGIASKAPMYLKNHKSVAETVCQLNFKDDTHILDQNT